VFSGNRSKNHRWNRRRHWVCPFEQYTNGLTILADAGYFIAGATAMAAKACILSSKISKSESGFAADLTAFSGNLVEDVKAFIEPRFVMTRGTEHMLNSITPIGDISGAKALTMKILKEHAGLSNST
jgi:hypothetical protein